MSHPICMVVAMPRPKTYTEARVATAVRIPESVHRRLQQAAIDRDVSTNLLVTRAVTEYLDRLPSAADVLDETEKPSSRSSKR